VKPTVGLISRAGVIPISHSQDTAGPLTRTVRDSAILLNVLAARDPIDSATRLQRRPRDYTACLDKDGLKGARIGLPSDPSDPVNDFYFGKLSPAARKAMARSIEVLKDLGATIVRANIPTAGWVGGPGTTMNVLNTNPLSPRKGQLGTPPVVFIYEFKRDLNLYLRDWAVGTKMKSLKDIVAYNAKHPKKALRFSQDLALAAEATRGDLSELEYRSARAMDLLSAKTRGLDAYFRKYRLDAVIFPGAYGCAIAAKPGYPSVQVPAGFVSGVEGRKTPPYPIGLTFTGPAWSEAKLLRFAYAFEQATHYRRPPKF
jgi:amidase